MNDLKHENAKLKIVAEIGKGLNGTVYRAVSDKNIEYALKKFDEKATSIDKERLILGLLDNKKNIIKCFKNLSDESTLVFELAESLGIENLIKQEKSYRYKYLLDVSLGIAECDEAGIIHGDIKENNIFLCGDENFKLSDFSAALFIPDSRNINNQINIEGLKSEGTPAYLPPEILNFGHDNIINKTQDIYAWGILAYKLFNKGKFPFEGNGVNIQKAIQERRKGKKATKPELMPLVLWKIVEKAILPDKEKREIVSSDLVNGIKKVIETFMH